MAELHQYLMDRIPPLTAFDSLELMMRYSPEALMGGIRRWISVQSRGSDAVPLADYIFHALKRLQLFADLKLIPNEQLRPFLEKLVPLLLEYCPPPDRELLAHNIRLLFEGEGLNSEVPPARLLDPSPLNSAVVTPVLQTEDAGRTLRRFSLIIQRLERQTERAAATREAPSRLAAMAAAHATTAAELEHSLERIGSLTGDTTTNIFDLLAAAIPRWDVDLPQGALQSRPAVKAMEKVLSLATSPIETARRYREMMAAAVQQINSGSLAPAIAMLELAAKIAAEQKIDAAVLARIQTASVDGIDLELLRKMGQEGPKRRLVRSILSFFPALGIDALLDELKTEERRERRRVILTLLEIHGSAARRAALLRLEAAVASDEGSSDLYYLRNLLYLLRRITPGTEASAEKEIDLVGGLSTRDQPTILVREAIPALGVHRTDKAVRVLVTRLAEFEALLARGDTSLHSVQDIQMILDRLAMALSRTGQPRAYRAVATHGIKPAPSVGETRARLSYLASHDLSVDSETVSLLIRTIRGELPGKLLGRVLPRKQTATVRLLEALAGTRTAQVLDLLREIEGRYGDQELGRAASSILQNAEVAVPATATALPAGAEEFEAEPQAAAPASSSLTGDLQFFALPTLLQGLADTAAWGELNIVDSAGGAVGTVQLVAGRIAVAKVRNLQGEDAVLQLLERPVDGRFAFNSRPAPPGEVEKGMDVMGVLLEGMRRFDELQEMSALIPDDTAFKAGGRPSRHPDENDPSLLREVWLKATSGAPVRSWEPEIQADAYRIRKLLAHWFEEGALVSC